MKKLLLMCVLGLFCMKSFADDLKSVVDSSDNVLTVKVNGTEDIKRIPVEVNMSNPSVPMTCVQCYLQLSDTMAVFCQDKESNSYLFSRTPRWKEQHHVLLAWDAKHHRQSLMAMVVSSLSDNFTGTAGPVLTVYVDGSSLADGTYSVRLFDANMVWTDKRKICSYLTPESTAVFNVVNGRLQIP